MHVVAFARPGFVSRNPPAVGSGVIQEGRIDRPILGAAWAWKLGLVNERAAKLPFGVGGLDAGRCAAVRRFGVPVGREAHELADDEGRVVGLGLAVLTVGLDLEPVLSGCNGEEVKLA